MPSRGRAVARLGILLVVLAAAAVLVSLALLGPGDPASARPAAGQRTSPAEHYRPHLGPVPSYPGAPGHVMVR